MIPFPVASIGGVDGNTPTVREKPRHFVAIGNGSNRVNIRILPTIRAASGGECSIAGDDGAVANLGLITSHGFFAGNLDTRWFGDHHSRGIDVIREKRPDIHAWVTSTSWAEMDVNFVRQIYGSIYHAKVNGLIPWAGIQRPPHWVGGDPNPGNAIQVSEDGTYEVRRGYYFYKQVTRAGQPGMAVARTMSMDTHMPIIAFSRNGTSNPDAFVVINNRMEPRTIEISLTGNESPHFEAFRTTDEADRYLSLGNFETQNGKVVYEAPGRSVTTFFRDSLARVLPQGFATSVLDRLEGLGESTAQVPHVLCAQRPTACQS